MGIFSGKKKSRDVIEKYFKEKNISLEFENGKYSFVLVNQEKGFSLYPYFTYDDDSHELSFLINIRNASFDYNYKILNEFNLKSKYLKALLKDSIIFIEYNTKVELDEFREIMDLLIESVFMNSAGIDSL